MLKHGSERIRDAGGSEAPSTPSPPAARRVGRSGRPIKLSFCFHVEMSISLIKFLGPSTPPPFRPQPRIGGNEMTAMNEGGREEGMAVHGINGGN